jgi:hypothetical protein
MGQRPAFIMANLPMGRAAFSGARMCAWAISFGLVWTVATASAGGLNDLLNKKDLTPEGLARVVADFAFELSSQVQEPETFLQRKRGDCADFSDLASAVLTQHGYTTKLVVVMMSKQTHVVCYVKEAGGFLDYNHRADSHPVIASDGSLEDIADKVAGDFHSQWQMASAFRYRKSAPVYLDSVFATKASSARSVAGEGAENRVAKATRATPPARTTQPGVGATTAPVGVQALIN